MDQPGPQHHPGQEIVPGWGQPAAQARQRGCPVLQTVSIPFPARTQVDQGFCSALHCGCAKCAFRPAQVSLAARIGKWAGVFPSTSVEQRSKDTVPRAIRTECAQMLDTGRYTLRVVPIPCSL